MGESLLDIAKEYSDVKHKIEEIEADLEVLKGVAKPLSEALLAKMLEDNLTQIGTTRHTLYVRRDIYANLAKDAPKDWPMRLVDQNHGDWIRRSLIASEVTDYIKKETGGAIPPALAGIIEVKDTTRIQALRRKS